MGGVTDAVPGGERVCVTVYVAARVGVLLCEAEVVTIRVAVRQTDREREGEMVAMCGGVGDAVVACVCDREAAYVALRVPAEREGVRVSEWVTVTAHVGEREGVAVGVGVTVREGGVTDGVRVGVRVAVVVVDAV